jgi:alpha-glucosidase
MVMVEQDVQLNRNREDEFTFGDKILISPVFEPGQKSKNVYLPKGMWYNYWTHESMEGGIEHTVLTPLESMPIFVKAGSVIPEWPLMQYVGEIEPDEIKFQIYFSDYEVNSFYYEDHGDTFAYEQEIYTEKKFIVKGDKTSFNIKQGSEGLYTPRYETYELKLIGLPFLPTKLIIDGKEQQQKLNFDELTRVVIKANKNFKEIQVLR